MIELVTKPDKQLFWHFDWSTCYRDCVTKHQEFDIREQRTRFEFVQCLEFLIRYTQLSADRRPDIDSEWATDHLSDFDVG